jgi:hypothetical protein
MTTSAVKKAPVKRTKKTVEDVLPSNPFIFEIFQHINKQRTVEKKIQILKEQEHPSLKSIFIWNFDDNVISMLPEGEVPYSTVSDDLVKSGSVSEMIEKQVEKMESNESSSVSYTEKIRTGHTTLRTEYLKLINFVKSKNGVPGNRDLPQLRRESMFIQLLEGLHPLDAEIMCLVKDKQLQKKYKITKELVSKAYPDIVWEQNR